MKKLTVVLSFIFLLYMTYALAFEGASYPKIGLWIASMAVAFYSLRRREI